MNNPSAKSPGPWRFKKSANGDWFLADKHGKCILQAALLNPDKPTEQLLVTDARGDYQVLNRSHPDARLIEAAPAMFDCLTLIEHALEMSPEDLVTDVEILTRAVKLALSFAVPEVTNDRV